MKNVFKFIIVAALVLVSAGSYAQAKTKFGHIDAQSLIALMPERNQARDSLERLSKTLSEELEVMQVEFNNMYEQYLKDEATLTKLSKQEREERLGSMQQRIGNFQAAAQEELQKSEGELLKPIYDKLRKAIEDVGKENGFIYIFDVNSVLFHSDQSIDVSDLVKTKLGIK